MKGYVKGTIGSKVHFCSGSCRNVYHKLNTEEQRENRATAKLSKLILGGDVFDGSEPSLDALDNRRVYLHPRIDFPSGNVHLPHQTPDRIYDGITPNSVNDIDD